MNEEFTFENIPLGAHVTYRSSCGILKDGRVIRKQEKFLHPWRVRGNKSREVVRRSILVEITGAYSSGRVNLTQFNNVLQVRA